MAPKRFDFQMFVKNSDPNELIVKTYATKVWIQVLLNHV